MMMLSCRDVSQLVSESLDRKLSFRQRMQVRLHLLMCRLCSRFRRQTLFLRDAGRRLAVEETDDTLSPEARERIKQLLKSDV
jgi:hypothetical protein